MQTRLPRDARVYLESMPWATRLRCRLWFLLADLFGFWSHPARIDPDPVDFPQGELAPYWFYKARKPIVVPEKGSGLEEYFGTHRAVDGPLVPNGFREECRTNLSAVGDLMNAAGTENSGGVFYSEIAELVFGADVSFANLESTLTSGEVIQDDWAEDDAPKINATPQQYDALKEHEGRRYTILQTANNHILDCGLEGFDTTHDIIEADGFQFVGTNRRSDDRDRGLVLTSNGVKVGFVAATYGVNCRPYPDGKTWMVNHISFHTNDGEPDLSLLERQIGWCRSEGCDLVVLALHWGLEHELYPRPEQLEMAHSLVESGADIILGHHAHNMQPYELFRSEREPDRVVPIFYGLGNLSCPMAAPHNVVSQIVNLEIVKGTLDGKEKTLVKDFTITPVIQVEEFEGDVQRLRIQRLTTRLAAVEDSESREYLRRAVEFTDKAIGSSWRE